MRLAEKQWQTADHLSQRLEAVTAAPQNARRLALRGTDTDLTYAELNQLMGRAASGLRRAGCVPGHCVGIASESSASGVAALLGIIRFGGIACPIEPKITVVELRRRIAAAKITVLVVDSERYDSLRHSDIANEVRLIEIKTLLSSSGNWLAEVSPDAGALGLFTSGSTGDSKAVLLTSRGLLLNAEGVIERTVITPEDRLLHFMPLYHTNGICNQVIAPLLAGATVILKPRFRAEELESWLVAERPTYFTGVPTMFYRILQHDFSKDALRSLRLVRCGSAPVSEAIHRSVEEQLGVPFVVSYGCTEATCTSTMNPPGRRRIGTVGTALQGQEIGILDEHNQVLDVGVSGAVGIRGDALMAGYMTQGPDGPMEMPVQNGWLHTGDIGYLDSEGYLKLTGKAKNVIIRGGENLSPEQIEHTLLNHSSVDQCCVIGVPDEEYGEVPLCYVVARGSDDVKSLQGQLEGLIRERLSPANIPHYFRVIDSLPENSVGKVDRLALGRSAEKWLKER